MPKNPSGSVRTQDASPSNTGNLRDGLRKLSRLGIGPRLMFAFGASAFLTLVASGVAWFSFGQIGDALRATKEESLPALGLALEITSNAEALSAAAPRLAAANSQDERTRHNSLVQRRSAAIAEHLEQLTALLSDPQRTQNLGDLVRQSVDNLQQINALVDDHIRLQAERNAIRDQIGTIQQEILSKLVPAVDDANFELILGAENVAEGGAQATQAFLEEGVERLRAVSGKAGMLLAEPVQDRDIFGEDVAGFANCERRHVAARVGLGISRAPVSVKPAPVSTFSRL